MSEEENPSVRDSKGDDVRSRRRRNRPFPSAPLEDAVRFIGQIYDFGAGQPVRRLRLFDNLSRSPESSASRDIITNCSKYGLLRGSYKSEELELTEDATQIVRDDARPRERTKAKFRVGIENIEAFRGLYDKISGGRLPAPAVLADQIKEFGISDDMAAEAVDLFVVNMRYVGVLQVLSGAERVLKLDDTLDSLPSSSGYEPRDYQYRAQTDGSVEPRALVTQEHANFEKTCFYITPIGSDQSEQRKHSDLFLGSLVEPAISAVGLTLIRADAIDKPGVITKQIIEYILKSRLVVADLSYHNPNVFYELALRHATRLPVVQIVRKADSIPFDVNQMRTIVIDNTDIYAFVPKIDVYKAEISAQARRALEAGNDADNPISTYFPGLRTSLS